jgi:hypothetical protein
MANSFARRSMGNLQMDFERILGVTFFKVVLTQSLCEKDTIYLTCRLLRAGPRRAIQLVPGGWQGDTH